MTKRLWKWTGRELKVWSAGWVTGKKADTIRSTGTGNSRAFELRFLDAQRQECLVALPSDPSDMARWGVFFVCLWVSVH